MQFSRSSSRRIFCSNAFDTMNVVCTDLLCVVCLLFINRVRGLYCKIQSPRSAVQPELARAVRGD